MNLEYTSTRSFTMTLAHRAVEDIRRGGFRQLRNYVDMCATLSKKTQQKDFFAYAQKALQRTDSCYYTLIHTLLDTVDEERVCTVGVNIGFGGLVYGASKMKTQAEKDAQPCSWITAARCGDAGLPEKVRAGEKNGCFVWVLDATSGIAAAETAALARACPQSAFGVLADPETLTDEALDALAPCMNIAVLPLLRSPELTAECCRAARELKARKMLYMLTVLVDADSAEATMQQDWMEALAQETLFCMYANTGKPDAAANEKKYRAIVDGRKESGRSVLLLDWDGDISYLNRRISECAVIGSALPDGASFPLNLKV